MAANGSIFASYAGARACFVAGSGCWGGFILCQVKWHFRRICWHHAKKQSEKDDENQTERRK
jgi:hypothetical protein